MKTECALWLQRLKVVDIARYLAVVVPELLAYDETAAEVQQT